MPQFTSVVHALRSLRTGLVGFVLLPVLAHSILGQVHFVEVAAQSGIEFQHSNFPTPEKYLFETMGAGGGFLDYDNDGWLDIYLLDGASLTASTAVQPVNRLFRNKGDGSFEETTATAGVGDKGYGMGLAVGDYDGDGDSDLYVVNYGPNVLYRNRGDGRFEDVSALAGVGDAAWGSSAGFFDYDRDGDLDLYVVNYLDFTVSNNVVCRDYEMKERSYCHPHHFDGVADRLYRNNGDGTFSDVAQNAGLGHLRGKGLGVVLTDLDLDGWVDIYVANDSVGNFLFRNKGDGTFEDLSLISGTGYSADGRSEAGMGTDAADLDADGLPELFVTNLDYETNSLYWNRGKGLFEDQTATRGLGEPSWVKVGFGARFLDYDNDGDPDLFVANGHILDNIHLSRPWLTYPQSNQLFENTDGSFKDVSSNAGPGLALASVSRGVAVGDYDNDGDVDVLVTNCGGPAQLLRNDGGNKSNWIMLMLQGRESNRDGYGVRIEVEIGSQRRFYEKVGGGSYQSAHDPRLHVGLGASEKADQIRVFWPSGKEQVLKDVLPGFRVVREP